MFCGFGYRLNSEVIVLGLLLIIYVSVVIVWLINFGLNILVELVG